MIVMKKLLLLAPVPCAPVMPKQNVNKDPREQEEGYQCCTERAQW